MKIENQNWKIKTIRIRVGILCKINFNIKFGLREDGRWK